MPAAAAAPITAPPRNLRRDTPSLLISPLSLAMLSLPLSYFTSRRLDDRLVGRLIQHAYYVAPILFILQAGKRHSGKRIDPHWTVKKRIKMFYGPGVARLTQCGRKLITRHFANLPANHTVKIRRRRSVFPCIVIAVTNRACLKDLFTIIWIAIFTGCSDRRSSPKKQRPQAQQHGLKLLFYHDHLIQL